MIPTNKEQVKHEIQMHRLLAEILDDKYLAVNFFFKGGTCARMLGFLDRFSVDLDFDLKEGADKQKCREKLYKIFSNLGLEIKDESKKALQFFLKYDTSQESESRNKVKLEILDKTYTSNKYNPKYIAVLGRTAICQDIETMFAHKLIAPIDRHENGGKIAGRDIYDIHYFFSAGHDYNKEAIKERRGVLPVEHFRQLEDFVEKYVTRKTIEDLNTLLDYKKFSQIKKYLKEETLRFIKVEIENLS